MALKPGNLAPDFKLADSSGKPFHLLEILKFRPVVIFFYPKDFTTVCTREVCSFRDDFSFFREHNVELAGISHDNPETHKQFADKYQLPFTLLSDPRRRVAKIYDAVFPFGILTSRITYLIGMDGKIRAALDEMRDADAHIRFMKNQILEIRDLFSTSETRIIPG